MDFPVALCRSTVTLKPNTVSKTGPNESQTFATGTTTGVSARVMHGNTSEGLTDLRNEGRRGSTVLLPVSVMVGKGWRITVTAGEYNGVTYEVQGPGIDMGGAGVMQSVPVEEIS